MALAYRNPWKLSSLVFAICEVAIALLLLLQISFAFLVFQLMKHLCVSYNVEMGRISLTKVCGYSHQNRLVDEDEDDGREVIIEEEGSAVISAINKPTSSTHGCMALTRREICKQTSVSSEGFDQNTQGFDKKTEEFDRSTQLLGDKTEAFDWNAQDFEDESEERDRRSSRACDQGARGASDEAEYWSANEGTHCHNHTDVVMRLEKAMEAQHLQLRRIHTELEEERGAAESAANEAMAMILRLQEEKSALLLESAHFRRMAEERAIHDEEAIRILESNLCRKEAECLILEEEVLALRARSVGKADVNALKARSASKAALDALRARSAGLDALRERSPDLDALRARSAYLDALKERSPDLDALRARSPDLDALRTRSIGKVDMTRVWQQELDGSVDQNNGMERNVDRFGDDDGDDSSIVLKHSALGKQPVPDDASEGLWNKILAVNKESATTALESYAIGEHGRRRDHAAELIALEMKEREEEEEEEEEEKVVNIDVVARMKCKPSSMEAYMPEDMIEVLEGEKKAKHYSEFEDAEACEEELKHLDMPSLVPSLLSPQLILSTTDRIKFEAASNGERNKGGNRRFESIVKLEEDIESRIRMLEARALLLRDRSTPLVNKKHVDLVNEIQGLLQAVQPVPNLKGGRPRKCLFADDPEMMEQGF